MASRSFKPASYLAAAGNRSPRQRPQFTRTSSTASTQSSSTLSTTSDDALFAALKGLHLDSEVPSRSTTPVHQSPTLPPSSDATPSTSTSIATTPGRKRSQPIAIELPSRGTAAYTPLSARGDLPGGYFPHHGHEESTTRHYRPHPFSSNFPSSFKDDSPMRMPTNLTPASSETTPKLPTSMLSGPRSPGLPESLIFPTGKYHPSNYKSPDGSGVSTPTVSLARTSLSPTNLSIPPRSTKHSNSNRPGHERKSSDVKRKLQQYQRDMIVQAQFSASTSQGKFPEPSSPRLLPLGSPGPITPFELEEADGYMVAGSAAVRKENERQIGLMLNEPYGGKAAPK